jgi:hypothetical protein
MLDGVRYVVVPDVYFHFYYLEIISLQFFPSSGFNVFKSLLHSYRI